MSVAANPMPAQTPGLLDTRKAALVFLAFALAYFCSALVRAITATLSPVLTQEFSLQARDLGLLAGGYFLGFAAMQLPMGNWLDRHGPRGVILGFLGLAVAGCLAFSMATSFMGLLLARVLIGMGVGACLMAPLTGYRRWLNAATQLRANSWMLMTGSFGILASTLPVQWLLPQIGWRPLFWLLAGMILLAMAAIAWVTPVWQQGRPSPAGPAGSGGYAGIWSHPYLRRIAPLAVFNYGGVVAIQTLWAGPWMLRVSGYTPLESATGLFWISAAMLVTYWLWGLVTPRLTARGWNAERLLAWGVPFSLLALAANIAGGSQTGWPGWLIFCVTSTVLTLSQPAAALAFPAALAGRALSAVNLLVFAGVFTVQWGLGFLIDMFRLAGLAETASFQSAMAVFLCCCITSYGYFLYAKPDNPPQ